MGSDERCINRDLLFIFAKHGKDLFGCVLTAVMGFAHGVIFRVSSINITSVWFRPVAGTWIMWPWRSASFGYSACSVKLWSQKQPVGMGVCGALGRCVCGDQNPLRWSAYSVFSFFLLEYPLWMGQVVGSDELTFKKFKLIYIILLVSGGQHSDSVFLQIILH